MMEEGERAALVTVVRTSGSTYRRAGARMLVTESGRAAGGISGGCLEQDAIVRAQIVMRSGTALLRSYDGADESVFGMGLGCNGSVDILIEPCDHREDHGLIPLLDDCLRGKQPF